ncbi:hypothetical protein PR202_gb28471 [Eleusine coracana subsp. coracana]|uniref:DUF668 domain-containing protein n=1 Tax=Eleusine coracana subsp. coracana TaxID=191504 RepID=A0AAV5FUJ4_ELECO|nr:hypothetical protein PR202_gb28471 [Eleusine coracana subsp. coracana]
MEATVQYLINLAQNTSELYHELHALDRFETDFRRKFHEDDSVPATRRESVMILHSELKRQRKLVKNLKKKSLWSKNLEEIVEKLVDIVIFLHRQIRDAFSEADTNKCVFNSLQRTVAQIKAEMQKTLRWLLPIAENTLRAHQGFGWVGEWANLGSDMSKKSGSQNSVTRIQTLHHADKEKTEHYILELVVLLHHLVVQVKNRGYGNRSTKHNSSRSRKGLDLQAESMHNTSPVRFSSPLSDWERETLEQLSFKRTSYGRSKSCEPPSGRGNKAHRSWDSCRSQGSSPAREFARNVTCSRDKARDLDVIDGLDRLTSSYSHPSSPAFC